MSEDLPFACADVAVELRRWLAYLGAERRMSPKTVEAYERDARQFLGFLTEHSGEQISLRALAEIESRDVRAFMAARRLGGIGSRSLMRSLAGVRSFARFLERTALPVTIANLTAHDVRIRLIGDVAIIHARTSFRTDGRAGSGRYTDVWARRDGRWLEVVARHGPWAEELCHLGAHVRRSGRGP